jgi:hypothetical protein
MPPCEHRDKKLSSSPSKPEHLEEGLPTSRWRSLASSSSRVRQTPLWRPLSPPPRSQTLPRCALVLPQCAPPLPLTARWRALPRPSRAPAPLPPLQLLLRGARDSTSRGGPPPIALLFFLLSRRRVLRSRRGRESLLLAQSVLLIPLLPALPPPDSLLLPACRPLLLPSLRGVGNLSGSRRGRVGPRGVHGHPLLKNDCQNRAGTLQGNEKGRKAYSTSGCRGA